MRLLHPVDAGFAMTNQ